MTAAFCLGHNAMYFFVGSFIPFGDAVGMIDRGAPRWLLFLFGVPLLVGFVLVLKSAIEMVGLSSNETVGKRIILVEVGLLTFPLLMVTSMLFIPVRRGHGLPTVIFVACYAVCFSIAAYGAHAATAKRDSDIENIQLSQGWSVPSALIIASIVLVLAEWLAFGAA
jgi:hypothetical protein